MPEDLDLQFYQLVLNLQASALWQLGKVPSPISGKIERNLEMAKVSIDLLEMLERKTKGNLNEEEKQLLTHVLFEARLNYVDEVEKDRATQAGGKVETEAPPQPEGETGQAGSEGAGGEKRA